MSYSAVDPSALWPAENPQVVSTRLAYTDDQGGSWTDSGTVVNAWQDVDLSAVLAPPLNAGTWQNEVSSLVFDSGPSVPAGQRWKLLWHHYLVLDNLRQLNNHAWIGLKMAASPDLLPAATEIKLFSSSGYDTANNTLGGTTKSPLGGAPAIALDTAFGGALTGGIFSEPGLLAKTSGLYLAMLCVNLPSQHRIILLKCCSACDPAQAANWSYLGTALADADAAAFGCDQGFSAPHLVSSGTQDYLIVTPVSSTPFDGYYNGCRVYRFQDLETATLEAGGPVVTVNGIPGSFHGAGTYLSAAVSAGLMYSQYLEGPGGPFRIYRSGVNF
jgi:hypothetical protein